MRESKLLHQDPFRLSIRRARSTIATLRSKDSNFRAFLTTIPGTHEYRRAFHASVRQLAKESQRLFMGLESIGDAQKEEFRSRVRHCVKRVALIDHGRNVVFHKLVQASLYVVIGLIVTALAYNPGIITRAQAATFRFLSTFFMTILFVLLPLSLTRIAALQQRLRGKRFLLLSLAIRAVFVAGFGWVVYLFLHARKEHLMAIREVPGVYAVPLALLVPPFIVSFDAMLSVVNRYAFRRLARALYPDAVIVDDLIQVIGLVEKPSTRWTMVNTKYLILERLEEIASCMEHDMPRRLRGRDYFTNSWIQERAILLATPFRELKMWVFTPKDDTRQFLSANLASCLIRMCKGDWDNLPTATPLPGTSKRVWVGRLVSLSKTTSICMIPILAFAVIQKTPAALSGPEAQQAKLVVAGLTGALVLRAVDPTLSSTLGAFKEALQSVTLLKGSR